MWRDFFSSDPFLAGTTEALETPNAGRSIIWNSINFIQNLKWAFTNSFGFIKYLTILSYLSSVTKGDLPLDNNFSIRASQMFFWSDVPILQSLWRMKLVGWLHNLKPPAWEARIWHNLLTYQFGIKTFLEKIEKEATAWICLLHLLPPLN